MDLIKNNPYRTVGLLVGSSAREQERQVKRLRQYIEAEKEPQDDFSFPALGNFQRNLEKVNDAASKLNLNKDRINAALFWFYKGNPITDEPAFDAFKDGNFYQAITIWSKLTSTAEVTQRNASAFSNLSTLYLSGALNGTNTKEAMLELGISLKIKFLESDFITDFKALATDETFKTTRKELQLWFLHELQSEIDKPGGISSTEFLEILNKQNFSAKEDFMKAFVQRPIEQIEQKIEATKAKRKANKAKAGALGNELYSGVSNQLIQLKGILGTNNLKYTSIADKVSDEILQCGIEYFSHYRDSITDPSSMSMELLKKAKIFAVGNVAKQRCQENTEDLEQWIKDKPVREKQNKIKADLDGLILIFKEFDNKAETIENAKSLINNCLPRLSNIKSALGSSDEFYLKISTRVASQAQSYIISEVNETQEDLQFKLAMDRYGTMSKLKSNIRNAWIVTNEIGSLDMDHDFKTNRFNRNKEALRGLCNQLGISTSSYSSTPSSSSTSTYSPSTNTSSSEGEGIPDWLKWIGGIILFIILIKVCN